MGPDGSISHQRYKVHDQNTQQKICGVADYTGNISGKQYNGRPYWKQFTNGTMQDQFASNTANHCEKKIMIWSVTSQSHCIMMTRHCETNDN